MKTCSVDRIVVTSPGDGVESALRVLAGDIFHVYNISLVVSVRVITNLVESFTYGILRDSSQALDDRYSAN